MGLTEILTGSGVFVIILTLIGVVYKNIDKRICVGEGERKEIKTNYLTKFEDLKEDIHDLEVKMLEKFEEIIEKI